MRRCDRWLQNQRIAVHQVYGPLIQQALAEWGSKARSLALDPSTLWETFCLVRIALIDRGRAVPIVWKVPQHSRRRVAYTVYADVLDRAASLLPLQCKVIFLADRGFADTQRMAHLKRFDWPGRIRLKSSFWLYRRGHRPCKTSRLSLALGEARGWHDVYITKVRYGPVHLARARRQGAKEE